MKRSTEDKTNINEIFNLDTSNETNNDNNNMPHKKIKLNKTIKNDANINFSVNYYEFKKLLLLFSSFSESIKITCSNKEIKMTIDQNFINNYLNSKSDTIDMSNLMLTNVFAKTKNANNKNNLSSIFAFFEKDKMIEYKTNLSESEIYETVIPIQHILDSLNSLNFKSNSVANIELSYMNLVPVVKIKKQISDSEYYSTLFEYDANNTNNTNNINNVNKILNKKNQKKRTYTKKTSKNSDSTSELTNTTNNTTNNTTYNTTNEIVNKQNKINMDQLLFSTTVKTIGFLEIITTIQETTKNVSICCEDNLVKLLWDSEIDNTLDTNLIRHNEYSLKPENNLDLSRTTNKIQKSCSVFTLYELMRYIILFSVDVSLHFFSDSSFIITSLIGESGKLIIEFK